VQASGVPGRPAATAALAPRSAPRPAGAARESGACRRGCSVDTQRVCPV